MPSFSIEAEGEANPLTENTLLHAVQSASSGDFHQIQAGTKQLQQWEKVPGYFKHLQSVFIARELPVEMRYLAIIQLKNGIDKYWRKTATNAVNADDKAVIRSRLLSSGLDEEDHRLALQDALVIAKVARYEYPGDWPDAINAVIDAIRSSNGTKSDTRRLANALLILLHIIKELSTARLQRSRTSLQAATPEIVAVLGQVYVEKVQAWQHGIRSGATDVTALSQMMYQSLLTIKLLRRLVVSGYAFPNRDEDVHRFWSLTFEQVGAFIELSSRQSSTLPSEIHESIEKHLLQLAKFHLDMARTHPAAFVLLPNSLDLVRAYWGLIKQFSEAWGSPQAVISAVAQGKIGDNGDQSDQRPTLEKLSLKGLLLIRACVKMVFSPAQTFRYRQAQEKEEKTMAEKSVAADLLTRSFVEEIMQIIVTRFFVFRESDLREWEEDPEEWERKGDNDSEGYEFSIRPCCEKLFLDLAINFKDILIEPLLAVFYSVARVDNEDILFKDSVYSAVGLSAAVLREHLDFDAFLTSTLVAEAQKQTPGYSIIRRRIAILLGSWITVKVGKESRPVVNQIFQHLLDPSDPLNDEVVRVTAGREFKNVADDWDFEAQHFLPFAEQIMTRLMHLIQEVELTETKMALLNTISVLVERLEHHITSYSERIINLLPPLWEQSGEEHLMKQAILAILARLVNALKADSVPFHSMLIPIIQGAVEPGSETQLYLLEDALDLWGAILVQCPQPATPEVLSLTPYLFAILELGSESLRKALEITESYLLLSPNHMLSDGMRKPILASLSSLLGTLKPDANGMVCNQVEIIIRTAQKLGGQSGDTLAVQQLTSDLLETHFLQKQLAGLHGSWAAHCTTGPLAKAPSVDGVVETDYFSVLARLTLCNPSLFIQAIQAAAPPPTATLGNADQDPSAWLLEEWFSHFENIGDPSRRKLMALALTAFLETAQPYILVRLQSLMTVWTDVITELKEGSADQELASTDAQSTNDEIKDSLVYTDIDVPRLNGDGPEAPEEARRRALTLSDPVHSIALPAFVKHHLQNAIQAVGGMEAFQREWLVNVDQEVLNGFAALGVI